MRGEEIAFVTENEVVHHLNVETYPSGEPMVKEDFTPNRQNLITRVLLRPRTSAGFLGGLMWVESLRERGLPTPELVIPNMFGARQDRINPTGDVLFTAKFVANMVNSLGAPRVYLLDPHSEVSAALVNRCRVVDTAEILGHLRCNIDDFVSLPCFEAVIAPDGGAVKRAHAVAKTHGKRLLHAWKMRDVKDGRITGYGTEDMSDFKGSRLLIVDDICDGGRTFMELDAKLPAGSVASLYVTHGIFSKGTASLLKSFPEIYCTDSIVTDRPGVKIIKVCDHILRKGLP
jgi:ribose-phosphate pyrophosphokinase